MIIGQSFYTRALIKNAPIKQALLNWQDTEFEYGSVRPIGMTVVDFHIDITLEGN